jgi:hypothetical protein
MHQHLFNEFLSSGDTLRVYQDNRLAFSSNKDRLLALLEYIGQFVPQHQQVVIFDTIIGNAAALLSVKANCREVYSPLGSQLAVETFDKYDIKYHITEIIPHIQKPDRQDMCPMEKLSIGKEPEEFYQVMQDTTK